MKLREKSPNRRLENVWWGDGRGRRSYASRLEQNPKSRSEEGRGDDTE